MAPTVLLVNPSAGGGAALRAAQAAERRCRERGLAVEVRAAKQPGDIELWARRLAAEGAERVLVCGGDGTVHEAANALGGTATVLGIIPAGRGNDLAAVLRIPAIPSAAVEVFLDGSVRRIDLGAANGRRFTTVLALGLDAEVALRTRAGVWSHGGRLGYVACAVSRLFRYRAPWLIVSGDFGRREGRYLLCAVSNTGRYGGGVRIAPGSSVDDGQLDVCLVRDLPRWKALRLIPLVLRGRHAGLKEVELLRSTWVQLESDRVSPIVVDGEPAGTTPARVTIEPGALRVMTP